MFSLRKVSVLIIGLSIGSSRALSSQKLEHENAAGGGWGWEAGKRIAQKAVSSVPNIASQGFTGANEAIGMAQGAAKQECAFLGMWCDTVDPMQQQHEKWLDEQEAAKVKAWSKAEKRWGLPPADWINNGLAEWLPTAVKKKRMRDQPLE
eukprot:gnl/MRDRNA2_/MRDRNA2_19250_c0_seq1.p1 gnl/MRDRNA2_/MRDRNA2_19250_c0~~gnl/MRDRNA2_/MRDRNA2_19250_c0_seq1.p1  ORF type:complete len:150 (+),score=43.48 gnl/MRDRNA2_/MRDRNA2_19250_c0_seq1:187-636(+)